MKVAMYLEIAGNFSGHSGLFWLVTIKETLNSEPLLELPAISNRYMVAGA